MRTRNRHASNADTLSFSMASHDAFFPWFRGSVPQRTRNVLQTPHHSQSNHVTRTYSAKCFSLQIHLAAETSASEAQEQPTSKQLQSYKRTLLASRKLFHEAGTSHGILLEPAQRLVGMSWHCASLSSFLRFSALPLRGNEAKIRFCWGPNWHLQTGGRDRNSQI